MSKSQTAKTFWVGISVFPIYLTCSSSGSETRICVPSSAPIFENVEAVEEEPSSTSRWLAGHPTAMMIGSAGAQGRRSEEEMSEEEAPWLGDDGKKKKVLGDDGKKEGERHYKRLGIL